MPAPRTVAITGANRGLGLEAAKALATAGCRVVLLCRTDEAATATAAALAAAYPEAPAAVPIGGAEVTSAEAMAKAAAAVKAQCPEGLDAVICNAGVWSPDTMSYADGAAHTVAINYFGVRNTGDAFIPLLARDGRLVHVSSRLGYLTTVPGEAQRALVTRDPMTVAELDALAKAYVADAAVDGAKDRWGTLPYCVSKILVNRLVELQAGLAAAGSLGAPQASSVTVVGGCPGYCATDMTGGGGRPAHLGGRDIANLACAQGEEWAAIQGKAGSLFYDGNVTTPWRTAAPIM